MYEYIITVSGEKYSLIGSFLEWIDNYLTGDILRRITVNINYSSITKIYTLSFKSNNDADIKILKKLYERFLSREIRIIINTKSE